MDYSKLLESAIYDPASLQTVALDNLEKAYNGEIDIPDASNPFIFLLENSSKLATASLMEISKVVKKMFPIMATDMNDLYPHIRPNEIVNLFGVPSKAWFTFIIKKSDIVTYGQYVNGSYIFTLPTLTRININDNFTFMLASDIVIKQTYVGKILVQRLNNLSSIYKEDNKVIEHKVYKDSSGVEWVTFNIDVPQIDYVQISDYIVSGTAFIKNIQLNQGYYFNSIITNNNTEINKTFSTYYFNQDVPTVYLKILEDRVVYHIPDIYVINNQVSGNISITQFTTLADNVPTISTTTPDKIKLIYPVNNTKISNATIWVKPASDPIGGQPPLTFEELKETIIAHSTGDNIIPIVEEELSKRLSEYDLFISDKKSGIFHRVYYADIDITKLPNYLNPEPFNLSYTINDLDIDGIRIVKDENYYIINPFNVFKQKDNTVVRDYKVETIDPTSIDMLEYLKDNNVFYNVYKYIIETTNNNVTCRVYDILNPRVSDIGSSMSSTDLTDVNIYLDSVTRDKNTYYVNINIPVDTLSVISNPDNLRIALYVNNSEFLISDIELTKDVVNNVYTASIPINTNSYIDDKNNYYVYTESGAVGIPIKPTIKIALYLTDKDIAIDNYIGDDILLKNNVNNILAINDYTIVLADYMEYINNNVRVDYTERKYKTYDEDVYLTYKENVYETDEYGIKLNYVDTDGDGEPDTAEPILLHKAGDPVLDENGNPIILHKAGDIMLDEEGLPIIDPDVGCKYTVELLGFEYIFKITNDNNTKQSVYELYNRLLTINNEVLPDIKKYLLENTTIKYKPKLNLDMLTFVKNSVKYTISNFITANVHVYIDETNDTTENINLIYNTIYNSLQTNLRTKLDVNTAQESIKNVLQGIIESVIIELPVDVMKLTTFDLDITSPYITFKKNITTNNGIIYPVLDLDIDITRI